VSLSTLVSVQPALGLAESPLEGTGVAPFAVQLSATPTGGPPPYTVSWSTGTGGATQAPTTSRSYARPGNYTATALVEDSPGQTATAEVRISVEAASAVPPPAPALVANATVTSSIVGTCSSAQDHYTFVGTATGGAPPYSYAWSFGDGAPATETVVTHVYTLPGVPAPLLTVTDGAGASVRIPAPLPARSPDDLAPCLPSSSPPISVTTIALAGGVVTFVAILAVAVVLRRRPPA
jgi:hypothetical protein